MNIVLCDRCGNEIPEAARLAKPVYPVYSARQTALDRYTGAEMGEASVEVFWKYARPIVEMSNALEKAGFLPGKPDGGA